jgi:hypothetical protein
MRKIYKLLKQYCQYGLTKGAWKATEVNPYFREIYNSATITLLKGIIFSWTREHELALGQRTRPSVYALARKSRGITWCTDTAFKQG